MDDHGHRSDGRFFDMSDSPERTEAEWRVLLIQADITNKTADTALKVEQRRWEPWKALAVAFAAGATFMAAGTSLAAWVLSHFR